LVLIECPKPLINSPLRVYLSFDLPSQLINSRLRNLISPFLEIGDSDSFLPTWVSIPSEPLSLFLGTEFVYGVHMSVYYRMIFDGGFFNV
jgi:hypothetical protein